MNRKIRLIEIIIVLLIFFVPTFLCGYIENYYTRNVEVYHIDNNIVSFIDDGFNVWEYEISDNDEVKISKKKYKLLMYNNGTENYIEDDVIIKIY